MVSPSPLLVSFPPRRRLAAVETRALPDELRRVCAGLERARVQADVLHREIQRWERDNEITVRRHSTLDLLTHRWIVQIPAAPLDDWGLLVGEVFHQLRSSLDRAAFAGARYVCGEDPPPYAKDIAFPVMTSPDKFRAAAKHRLRPFAECGRPDVIDAIEALQPYRDADGSDLPPHRAEVEGLGLLTGLHNRDKHREPHLVRFAAPASTAEYVTRSPVVNWTAVVGEVADGAEVAKVVLARSDTPAVRFGSDFLVSLLGLPLYAPTMLASLHELTTEAVHAFAQVTWRTS